VERNEQHKTSFTARYESFMRDTASEPAAVHAAYRTVSRKSGDLPKEGSPEGEEI